MKHNHYTTNNFALIDLYHKHLHLEHLCATHVTETKCTWVYVPALGRMVLVDIEEANA